MARVEIKLGGRSYAVSCEAGQEGRLQDIVAFVDAKMRAMGGDKPNVAETQMLVLTTLTLADQIFDLRSELAKARTAPLPVMAAASAGDDEALATVIENLANRVDRLATRLVEI